jgi:transmembrane sensor
MTCEQPSTIDEQASGWAARLDRGLSPAESRELEDWLACDPRRQGALLRAQAAWHVLDRLRALGPRGDAADELPPPVSRRRILQVGTGFAAMLAAGIGWQFLPRGKRYTTAKGEVRQLPLQDGSLAVVNTDSGMRVEFTASRRNVELSHGEAWFQVAKNRARPFVVSTGAIRVQAVGTAFDVRRREGLSEVVVTEGVVKIWSTASDGAPVLVPANHSAVVSESMAIAVKPLTAEQSDQRLAWREGRIVLDEMTLADAAAEFNRYNDVKLTVDPVLGERRLVGIFRINDVDSFVSASAALVGGRVERRGKSIIISK